MAAELSRHVVEAMVQIGLTQEEILGGKIEHTTLPWQIPPLIVEATVFGTPLSEFFNQGVYVATDALVSLYSDALTDMRNNPGRVLSYEGYRAATYAIPNVKAKERQLYLSVPEGFPGGISDYAGVLLGLECAHLMRGNSKIKEFTHDEDNYYATLPDGTLVGVKDGLPTLWPEVWDLPVKGMIQELLQTPRGPVFEDCDWNVTAKVRSIMYTYRKSIRDYEALDWAVQTLRVIEGEQQLLNMVRRIKQVAFNRRSRLDAAENAKHLVDQISITDRQRIEALKNVLVPEFMTVSQFSKQIYTYYRVPPAVLADKVLARIRTVVHELHHEEEALYGQATSTSIRSK